MALALFIGNRTTIKKFYRITKLMLLNTMSPPKMSDGNWCAIDKIRVEKSCGYGLFSDQAKL